MAKRTLLTWIVVLLGVIGLLPILVMFVKSLMVDGHISLASYKSG